MKKFIFLAALVASVFGAELVKPYDDGFRLSVSEMNELANPSRLSWRIFLR